MVTSTTQLDFLKGDSEAEALIRRIDWAETPLGPIAQWPQSLKISVRIMLGSRYPMFVWWGEQLTMFYNDAYARMTLARKHPWAMGRSAPEVWAEIWQDIGPRVDEVIYKGRATWDEELLLILERSGFPEETYHTFSYSPIPDDQGGIGGLLCAVSEETKQVLGRRRLRTLRELAARTTAAAHTVEDACHAAVEALAENPNDLAFALIYLADGAQNRARLIGATGLPAESPAYQANIDLAAARDGDWPLSAALATNSPELVTELAMRFAPLPGNVWPEPPHSALILPIKQPNQLDFAGFLVAGLSPRLALDDDYRGFLELTAGHISTAIVNAQAYVAERQRTEALVELNRAKTTFFSNISHEFRTPLTLMLGPLEESLAEAQAPAMLERLELMHRNALRLQKLVNALLDFSRIEAGRMDAAFAPTDLSALTRDLASVFRSAVEKAGMRLLVDCPPLSEAVYVDRDKWELIVLNLLSNAFKFTQEGEIEVRLREDGDRVRLMVRDTGSGIDAAQLPHIFERFHRVEGTRARTQEGTGIGLAFVAELVKLHGGAVDVASEVGQGSTFTVTLLKGTTHLPPEQLVRVVSAGAQTAPAALPRYGFVEEARRWLPEDEAASSALLGDGAPLPSAPPSAGRPRIVLADDNADMRDYVRRLLSHEYTVEAVSDGEAALAALRRDPPDLLLADVMMPRLDGFGLLQAVRNDETLRTLPVIILSARAGEEAKVEGLAAGADDYLIKPFSARELLARVGAQIELARVRRDALVAVGASEARYRALTHATSTLVYRLNAEGTLFLELADRERSYLPNGPVSVEEQLLAIHPEERAAVSAAWESAVAAQRPYEVEHRFPLDDGTWGWLLSSAVPVKDEQGAVVEWIGSATNITRRKLAEEAVRASEERLRLAIEGGNIYTWEVDLATGRVTYSANVADVLGFSLSDSSDSDQLVVHPDDREATGALYQAALRGESEYNAEYRFVAPNGSIVWVRSQGHFVGEPGTSKRRFLGITQNISERKRAELGLAALHEQLAAELASIQQLHEISMALQLEGDADALLDRILDAAITISGADKGIMQLFDVATQELYIRSQRGLNQAFLDYYARVKVVPDTPVAETLLRGSRTLVPDVYQSPLYGPESLEIVAQAEVRATQATPLITRDGVTLGVLSTYWRVAHEMGAREARMLDLLARAAADLIEQAQADAAVRALNETLERRVAERTNQMRESEARFRALVDASAQIVWTMDSEGRVVEDSPSWREFTGRTFAQSKVWNWLRAVHPEDRKRTIQNWRRALKERSPLDTEFRIQHRNGAWYWMQVRAVPLYDDTGVLRGWVGMNIDIHERKQAEADRERLARLLIMAEQEERRRLSQALHDDLQQLLYATQMRVAMIGQDLEAAGLANLMEEMEEASVWLQESIQTTRQMTVELSPPILHNEGLADALEWLLPQMEQLHGLKVVIVATEKFRILDEDLRALLFQIVRELLFNVAKHAGVDRAVVELGWVNHSLVIEVRDEGRGFVMEDIAQRSPQKEGFGLFSVQERLRLVGGTLEIRSAPGQGTRVTLYAPIQNPVQAERTA